MCVTFSYAVLERFCIRLLCRIVDEKFSVFLSVLSTIDITWELSVLEGILVLIHKNPTCCLIFSPIMKK